MVTFNCLSTLVVGKKNKSKKTNKNLDVKKGEANVKPRVKPIDLPYQSVENNARKDEISSPLSPKPKPTSNENMITRVDSGGADAAYEGGDEHDEVLSMKRDYSDLDLHAQTNSMDSNHEFVQLRHELIETTSERDEAITPDLLMQSGHVSDPGISRPTAFCRSPSLKRSCSNIETKRTNLQNFDSPTKSQSYTDLKNLSTGGNSLYRIQSSPLSAKSNCSADRVMLKKRSSSQVLPSRSRKVWWKLFLWSHRNLHKPSDFSKPPIPSLTFHQKAGYSSDTLEPSQTPEKGKNKAVEESGNQWVAFAMGSSSPLDRINVWVNSIDETELAPIHDSDDGEIEEQKKGGFEIGESSGKNHSSYTGRRTTEEVMRANSVIQSLSSFSSVAHISGMGLKVIPSISAFSSLRTINLSGNFIGQISPGSLPKSLHTLDLSRNKIATIEGLRDLTRLRVLNLSYNKISRIGHGLSNCTLIKELYLAGNKISNVEGLHRLLKLTVLDLSFNKLTTSKALGQLVANYNSLLALNLIGNPIQANIGDDQLRKAVTSLLPHLTYLNKQPIKPQRVREAVNDSIARAALGSGNDGRRMARRRSPSSGTGSLVRRASQSSALGSHVKGSRNRTKGRLQHSVTSSRK